MALPTSPFCVWYYRRKHWFANNVLGLAFRCVRVWRVGWLVYPFFVVMVVGREGQNVLIQELGLKQVTRQGHSLQLSHIRGPLQGIQQAAAGLPAAACCCLLPPLLEKAAGARDGFAVLCPAWG